MVLVFKAKLAFPRCYWRLASICICLAGCVPIHALDPSRALSQYAHTSWGSESGVQAVRRLTQTRDGYLWLATRVGLLRFDGARFTVFKAGGDQGLESSILNDLAADPDGSLWAASLGGGVVHYEAGKFSSHTSLDGLSSNDLQSLYQDSHGVLWIGTSGKGIARLIHGRLEMVPLPIPSAFISGFLEDADGALWISTNAGVFRLQNGILASFFASDGLPDSNVNRLCRDHSGRIWTAGWKGISYWNGTRFVGQPAVNAAVNEVISCSGDRDGNLWIASSSGLYREHGGTITKMDRKSGLSGDYVTDVFEDKEGNLWVATGDGLDRLRDGPVRPYSTRDGLPSAPGPIFADTQGAVWSVLNDHVARIADKAITTWPMATRGDGVVYTLLPESDSGFLIGFAKGVTHWTSKQSVTVPELANLEFGSFLRARDGTVWIASLNRGLLRWQSATRTLSETGISAGRVARVAEDRTGAIWAGSLSGDLYRLTGQQIQRFGADEGLRPPVFTIFVDGKGDPWIGSAGGLSWLHDGRIETVSSREGLPADQVLAIIEDLYDRLWFVTYAGIAAIEKKSLFDWVADRSRKLVPTMYGSGGLEVSIPGRFTPNAVRTPDGHLWFSIDGVAEVAPPAPNSVRAAVFPVLVENVTVDRISHPGLSRILVPPGSRSIEVEYTAITLSNPETLRFRYRLEGIDNDWVYAGTRRIAFYGNLKPGAYTFRVSASAGEDRWWESSALLLEQLPFFYQTRWFLAVASAIVLSMTYLGYRLRLRQAVDRIQAGFEERMNERTRIAYELHDSVVQAISGSTMLVENAAEKVPNSLPMVKGYLLRAVDKLDMALTESRAALKGLRNSGNNENDLARQFSDAVSDAQTPNVKFQLTVTGKSRALRPAIQYEVFRIGSEAISNAMKHSGASSLRVDLEYLNELRVLVHDDGKGIPEETLRLGKDGHFGLQGMQERADRIGASLEMYSRVGAGTEVRLTIPGHIAFLVSPPSSYPWVRVAFRILSFRRRPPAR